MTEFVKSSKSNQEGFSLLEIMVALAIASFALVTCYRAIHASIRTVSLMRLENRAVDLAAALLKEAALEPSLLTESSGLTAGAGGTLVWRKTIQQLPGIDGVSVKIAITSESEPERVLLLVEKLFALPKRNAR